MGVNILWMRTSQDDIAGADFAVYHSRLPSSPIDGDLISILRKNLHILKLFSIDKDASAIVVTQHLPLPKPLLHTQPYHSRAPLGMILEPLQRTTPTRSREEPELARPDNLEGPIADLELAPAASVVPTGTETEVSAAATDIVGDTAVAGTVEDAAVAQVAAARDDEESAGGLPGFFQEGGLGDGDDGVGWGEEAAEGVDAVADRFDGRAGA